MGTAAKKTVIPEKANLQEIESILDNPTEMADMYLGRRDEAARAELQQVCFDATNIQGHAHGTSD